MSVRIIVDSTADVTPQVRQRLHVVPLTIQFGEETFIDGQTITHQQFYEKLIESDCLPTTSQAGPAAFADEYEKAKLAGDEAVVLTVSAKLSGSYQSAMIAAQDYEQVYVVDTHSVALGSGILAQMALQLADDGLDACTIAQRIREERKNVHLIALLNTLEYLRRGGRISKTAAFAGSLLSLKPVICIRDGEIVALGKARGSRQGNNLLVKEIEAAGGVDFAKPLLLGYTGMRDDLLQKYIRDSAELWQQQREELPITIVGSVVGTHAGPDAVAVAFFKKP